MRMVRALIGAALLAVWSAPVGAQTPPDELADSSARMVRACKASMRGDQSECACVAGYFAAQLPEDTFHILSETNRFIDGNGEVADPAGLQAARVRLGISQTRFDAIMVEFQQLDPVGKRADRVCIRAANEASK
jgi:hypothetical protein